MHKRCALWQLGESGNIGSLVGAGSMIDAHARRQHMLHKYSFYCAGRVAMHAALLFLRPTDDWVSHLHRCVTIIPSCGTQNPSIVGQLHNTAADSIPLEFAMLTIDKSCRKWALD